MIDQLEEWVIALFVCQKPKKWASEATSRRNSKVEIKKVIVPNGMKADIIIWILYYLNLILFELAPI